MPDAPAVARGALDESGEAWGAPIGSDAWATLLTGRPRDGPSVRTVRGDDVTLAGNVRWSHLSSVDSHNYGTHGDLPFSARGELGIVEVPKSEAEVSADLRDEADRINALARALADLFGRKAVVVWPDDTEVVVEPRAERRLDG